MNITIRDRESSSFSSVNNGSVNFNFNPSQDNSVLPDVNTSTTDQFQASPETIKAGIGKEKDFNVDSKDDRIQQTSMKYYAGQLNTIKALNDSGKLAEMLEQVGSSGDTTNSWGYSLQQILDKAQIKRDGKTLSPSQLAEYLKNDKNGKIKESINSAIADIQGTSSFKEKLEKVNEKYDTESIKVGGATVGAGTLYTAYRMGVPKLAEKSIGKSAEFYGTRAVGAGFKAMGGKVTQQVAKIATSKAGSFVTERVASLGLKNLAVRGLPAILGIATGNAGLLAGAFFPPGLVGFAIGTAAWMVADYALKKTTGKDSSEYLQQVTSPVTDWVGDRFSEATDVAGYHLSKLV